MSGRSGTLSRRTVLRGGGAALAFGLGAGSVMNTGAAAVSNWTEASTPISKSLYDVFYTTDGRPIRGRRQRLRPRPKRRDVGRGDLQRAERRRQLAELGRRHRRRQAHLFRGQFRRPRRLRRRGGHQVRLHRLRLEDVDLGGHRRLRERPHGTAHRRERLRRDTGHQAGGGRGRELLSRLGVSDENRRAVRPFPNWISPATTRRCAGESTPHRRRSNRPI